MQYTKEILIKTLMKHAHDTSIQQNYRIWVTSTLDTKNRSEFKNSISISSLKNKIENPYPQLYKRWGIILIPVLGSIIGRKHSSIIFRAIANLILHSTMSAIFVVDWTFRSPWLHLRIDQEKPSAVEFKIPTHERKPE